jgi:hypothetical protein
MCRPRSCWRKSVDVSLFQDHDKYRTYLRIHGPDDSEFPQGILIVRTLSGIVRGDIRKEVARLLRLGHNPRECLKAAASRVPPCQSVLPSHHGLSHIAISLKCVWDSNNTFVGPSKQAVTVVRCRRLLPSQYLPIRVSNNGILDHAKVHLETQVDNTNYNISANPSSDDQTLVLTTLWINLSL